METTLHILNGDSTKSKFLESGIQGETVVWREVLSDGPVQEDFGSSDFWKLRKDFMTQFFSIPEGDYQKDVLDEFDKIKQFQNYKEVVFWFEYDLFCQVNMIGLLSWFGRQELKETKVSLICVGQEEGYEKLVGLGEIPTSEYESLFNRRRIMGPRDFAYAQDAFTAFCSEDPTDLETFTLLPSNEFPYVADAFRAQLKRFPSKQTGLNEIEEKMLGLINDGIESQRKLVGSMLQWQTAQGFGDLQYFNYLNRLEPLFEDFENLKLKERYNTGAIDRSYFLGGALVSAWVIDQEDQSLQPRA